MRRVCSIAVWALAACGRFGFDDVEGTDRDASDASDAGDAAIQPLELAISLYSTSSTTFTPIPRATLEIPPSPGRRWLLLTRASLYSTSLNENAVEIRYLVDGIERGIGGADHHELGKGAPWQHLYAFDGGAATISIGFELRDNLASMATVENLHAIAVPLPEAAVSVYASDDAEQMVTATTPTPTVVLDASVSSVEYLFFALAVGKEGTGSDIHVQWLGPDGTTRLREAQNARTSWQSQFTMWRETVAAPTARFTMRAFVSSGANLVRDVRVFGLRTTDFPSIDFAATPGPLDTTSMTPIPFAELAPLGIAPRYLLVASSRLDDVDAGCDAATYADRRTRYLADATIVGTTSYVISNCAHEVSGGALALLGQRPGRAAVEVSSGTGARVRAYDAAILLLGLP